jgi:hypothetical protein
MLDDKLRHLIICIQAAAYKLGDASVYDECEAILAWDATGHIHSSPEGCHSHPGGVSDSVALGVLSDTEV